MKNALTVLAVLMAFTFVGSANAGTIVFTGSESDFPATDLLEDDGLDTELFDCGFGPVDATLDIGTVYCTNDSTTLYIGLSYEYFCFCDIQIGIAIDVRPGGGSTDPFNRQIVWPGPILPDFVAYDVIPTFCNGFNYEVIFEDDGAGGWTNLGDGSNAWGFVDTDGGNFKEFRFPLSLLGATLGQEICLEMWITQDDFGSGLKPAFDMVANDAYPLSQKSTPGGPTLFDVVDGEESVGSLFLCKTLETPPVSVEPSSWGGVKALYR